MLVVCWSGDTSGQILVTLSGRGDIGQAVVSESANQVSDQLSRCGGGGMLALFSAKVRTNTVWFLLRLQFIFSMLTTVFSIGEQGR